MIDLEGLIQKTMTLEARYLDLQDKYQHLIHQYETLKEKHEGRNRHRNDTGSQDDLASKDD